MPTEFSNYKKTVCADYTYSRFHRNPPLKLKAIFIEAKNNPLGAWRYDLKMKMKSGPKVCVV
jgi:hypothetical protein